MRPAKGTRVPSMLASAATVRMVARIRTHSTDESSIERIGVLITVATSFGMDGPACGRVSVAVAYAPARGRVQWN